MKSVDKSDAPSTSYSLAGHLSTHDFLRRIGVPDLPPCTAPIDSGFDPVSVEAHLDQSAHVMEILEISMPCCMIADEKVTRRKVAAASVHSVPTVTGGESFEIAAAVNQLEAYLDLCADLGVTRVECSDGVTDSRHRALQIVRMSRDRGLEIQFQLGRKFAGAFTGETMQHLIEQGNRWLDAGALQLVVDAGENATDFGLFNADGDLHRAYADRLARAFGLEAVMFAAPRRRSQFALLDQLGRDVHLCDVPLSDLLRVEVYRRGLRVDSIGKFGLKPASYDVSAEL